MSFTFQDKSKEADKTILNYSFACSVDFTKYPVDEITMTDIQ